MHGSRKASPPKKKEIEKKMVSFLCNGGRHGGTRVGSSYLSVTKCLETFFQTQKYFFPCAHIAIGMEILRNGGNLVREGSIS